MEHHLTNLRGRACDRGHDERRLVLLVQRRSVQDLRLRRGIKWSDHNLMISRIKVLTFAELMYSKVRLVALSNVDRKSVV